MGECRRTVGGAELRALGAGSCCEAADLDEVVGEDAVPGPDPGSFGAVDAGAVPTVVSFEGADAAFAAGAPLDCSSERWPLFFGAPGLGEGLPLRGIATVRTPRSCRSSSTRFSP